jgi:hypothetical protein
VRVCGGQPTGERTTQVTSSDSHKLSPSSYCLIKTSERYSQNMVRHAQPKRFHFKYNVLCPRLPSHFVPTTADLSSS